MSNNIKFLHQKDLKNTNCSEGESHNQIDYILMADDIQLH
jgi:hypothetical protein